MTKRLKISNTTYTKESLDKYYEASADIHKAFTKLLYEAEKNYKEVTDKLYYAKVKSLQQAEHLLVLKGDGDAGIKESNS